AERMQRERNQHQCGRMNEKWARRESLPDGRIPLLPDEERRRPARQREPEQGSNILKPGRKRHNPAEYIERIAYIRCAEENPRQADEMVGSEDCQCPLPGRSWPARARTTADVRPRKGQHHSVQ